MSGGCVDRVVGGPRLSAARAPAFPGLPFCSLLFSLFLSISFLFFLALVGCGRLRLRAVHVPPLFFYLVIVVAVLFV